MRNTWLEEQLNSIQDPAYQAILQATKEYIEELKMTMRVCKSP